jgi:hypothetical protein
MSRVGVVIARAVRAAGAAEEDMAATRRHGAGDPALTVVSQWSNVSPGVRWCV